MSIFPGAQERLITLSILSFLLGLSLGLLAMAHRDLASELVPAVFTLVAAFLGAWVAFSLESSSRRRMARSGQLEAANKLLFALCERLSVLKLFQYDFIDPVRENPGRMVLLQPVAQFREPNSKLDPQSVAFLFQSKHKQLLLGLNVVNEMFNAAVDMIRMRSDLHLNTVQPLMEQAGCVMGQTVSGEEVLRAVGDRNFHVLRQSTDNVVQQVDTFLSGGDKLRSDLISAFSEVFSREEIFSFEVAAKPESVFSTDYATKVA